MVACVSLTMYKTMTYIFFYNFLYLLGMIWKNNTTWQTINLSTYLSIYIIKVEFLQLVNTQNGHMCLFGNI